MIQREDCCFSNNACKIFHRLIVEMFPVRLTLTTKNRWLVQTYQGYVVPERWIVVILVDDHRFWQKVLHRFRAVSFDAVDVGQGIVLAQANSVDLQTSKFLCDINAICVKCARC